MSHSNRSSGRLMCGWVLLVCSLAGCGSSKKPIVVGGKTGAEQTVLGEIVAQHLEKRLPEYKIERQPNLGNSPILYQAISGGQVTIYPESIGIISSKILKETPSADPAILWERSRLEMARIAVLELLPSLGFDDAPAVVMRSAAGPETDLSAAAAGKSRWKLGISRDFNDDGSGMPVLNTYHLPMTAPIRTIDPNQMFDLLMKGDVNMIVTSVTDGHLNSADWKVLADDRKVFPSQQVCLLVRQDRVTEEPRLRPALAELSGKLSPATIRKFNQQVEIDHQDPARVAAEFLAASGL